MMAEPPSEWTASISVRAERREVVDWLEEALRPEAAREVPRARAEVSRGPDRSLELAVATRDLGAMRAALNTYLGWIHLGLATARAADRPK